MVNYQNGRIYKLVSNHTNDIYIGSTTRPLHQRLWDHKSDNESFSKGLINKICSSKQLYDLGKVEIILIENYPCNSKEELLMRERHFIESIECVNKKIPIRTVEERKELKTKYILSHKKEKKEYDKNYHTNHSIKKIQIQKEWRLNNIEKRLKYEKDYKDKTKDKRKDYDKKRSKEMIGCRLCKCEIVKSTFNRHCKSKKHIENEKLTL